MSWVAVIWSIIVGIYLSMAGVYLLVWFRNQKNWTNLSFSFWTFSVASWMAFELLLMHSRTPEQYGQILRWMHIPMSTAAIGYVWFARSYLRAGRLWLLKTLLILSAVKLAANFMVDPNIIFSEITSLQQVPFLGKMVAVPVAVAGPWELPLSLLFGVLVVVFIVDAAISA